MAGLLWLFSSECCDLRFSLVTVLLGFLVVLLVLLRTGILVSEGLLFGLCGLILVVACGWVGLALVCVGLVLWLLCCCGLWVSVWCVLVVLSA